VNILVQCPIAAHRHLHRDDDLLNTTYKNPFSNFSSS